MSIAKFGKKENTEKKERARTCTALRVAILPPLVEATLAHPPRRARRRRVAVGVAQVRIRFCDVVSNSDATRQRRRRRVTVAPQRASPGGGEGGGCSVAIANSSCHGLPGCAAVQQLLHRRAVRYASGYRWAREQRRAHLQSKMLGGASQIVSMIRVECNAT